MSKPAAIIDDGITNEEMRKSDYPKSTTSQLGDATPAQFRSLCGLVRLEQFTAMAPWKKFTQSDSNDLYEWSKGKRGLYNYANLSHRRKVMVQLILNNGPKKNRAGRSQLSRASRLVPLVDLKSHLGQSINEDTDLGAIAGQLPDVLRLSATLRSTIRATEIYHQEYLRLYKPLYKLFRGTARQIESRVLHQALLVQQFYKAGWCNYLQLHHVEDICCEVASEVNTPTDSTAYNELFGDTADAEEDGSVLSSVAPPPKRKRTAPPPKPPKPTTPLLQRKRKPPKRNRGAAPGTPETPESDVRLLAACPPMADDNCCLLLS
jgi:hypothetical protein